MESMTCRPSTRACKRSGANHFRTPEIMRFRRNFCHCEECANAGENRYSCGESASMFCSWPFDDRRKSEEIRRRTKKNCATSTAANSSWKRGSGFSVVNSWKQFAGGGLCLIAHQVHCRFFPSEHALT